MASSFEDLKSNDPWHAELARGFNKLYLTCNDMHDVVIAFKLLYSSNSIDGFLDCVLKLRESKETLEDLDPKKDTLKCLLVDMHDSKIISLDPDKPFMVMQKGQVGTNNVQIGERWYRQTPPALVNKVVNTLYGRHCKYRSDVKDLTGTDFEKYLTKEMSQYGIEITFQDGICYFDPQNIINPTAKKLLFKGTSDFSQIVKLMPQIVPDIVIEYINLTMVIPRRSESNYELMKYNMVQRTLGIDYSVLKNDLPLCHPEVVKYLKDKYQIETPLYGDVLPDGNIRKLLEKDRYMHTLAPTFKEFQYPD